MKFIKLMAPAPTNKTPRTYVAYGLCRAGQEKFRVTGETSMDCKQNLLFVAKALKAAGTEVEFVPNFAWREADFKEVLG